MTHDSRPHQRDFRNEKDHGYNIVGYVLSRLDKIRKEYIRVRKGYGYIRSRLGTGCMLLQVRRAYIRIRISKQTQWDPMQHILGKDIRRGQGHILTLEMVFKIN
jgi:hypothetical protein